MFHRPGKPAEYHRLPLHNTWGLRSRLYLQFYERSGIAANHISVLADGWRVISGSWDLPQLSVTSGGTPSFAGGSDHSPDCLQNVLPATSA